jgi:hypothetical protein
MWVVVYYVFIHIFCFEIFTVLSKSWLLMPLAIQTGTSKTAPSLSKSVQFVQSDIHIDKLALQAEDKLYNLYREILCKHSEFFNVMLSLPQSEGPRLPADGDDIIGSFRAAREKAKANGEDGSSDEKALVIPHTSQEFDYLLECIFWE